MKNNRLQSQITAGRWTLPAVIFTCTLCWFVIAFLIPDIKQQEQGMKIWEYIHQLLIPSWADRISCFLLYGIIGYFLIEINNQFTIIRIRASVQTSFYFMLVTACPAMHYLYVGDLISVFLLLSIFFLFKSYQQSQPSGCIFYSFFFISAGSIFFPPFIFLSILWFTTSYRFQSLSIRSIFAALLGLTLPYWLLFAHAVFYHQIDLFYTPFKDLITFTPIFNFEELQKWELFTLLYLLMLFIVSSVHCFITGYEDKIRTRSYLRFIISLTFYIFMYIAIQPSTATRLLPLVIILVSILIGHLFALTNSKISNLFFIGSMVSLILLFINNIWTLL